MSNFGFGTTGQILTSNGPGIMPSFQAAGGGGGSTVYFASSLTSTYTNVTGDGTQINPVVFDSVSINQGSAYDNTTGIFTAPHDDFYYFSACIRMSGVTPVTNTDLFMSIQWSDFIDRIEMSAQNMSTSGGALAFPMSGGVYLTTGSQVQVAVAVNGSAPSVSIEGSSDTSCNFTGFSLH